MLCIEQSALRKQLYNTEWGFQIAADKRDRPGRTNSMHFGNNAMVCRENGPKQNTLKVMGLFLIFIYQWCVDHNRLTWA